MTHRDDDIQSAFHDETRIVVTRDLIARAIAEFRTSEACEGQKIAMRSELEQILAESNKA